MSLQPKYPDYPFFQHLVFKHPLWPVYRAAEEARVAMRAQAWAKKSADMAADLQRLHTKVAEYQTAAEDKQQQLLASIERLQTSLKAVIEAEVSKLTAAAPAAAPEPPADPQPSAAAPSAAEPPALAAGSAAPVATLPLPVFPVKIYNIEVFYMDWVKSKKHIFEAHTGKYGRPKWQLVWDKANSSVQKQRYDAVKPFLTYMDSVAFQPAAATAAAAGGASSSGSVVLSATKAVGVLRAFAAEHELSDDDVVRSVFYYMVKFEGKCPAKVRELASELRTKLVAAGLTAPMLWAAQVKRKRVDDELE